jgi:hypothetical protein
LLAGLADGLAPKERRYALNAISPNNLGPPLPRHLAPWVRRRREFSCTGAAIVPTQTDEGGTRPEVLVRRAAGPVRPALAGATSRAGGCHRPAPAGVIVTG